MKHTGYISEKEKKNSRFFLLCIVEIIGILIGSYIAVSDTNTDWFRKFLCPVLNGGTLSEIFRSTFISSLIFCIRTAFGGCPDNQQGNRNWTFCCYDVFSKGYIRSASCFYSKCTKSCCCFCCYDSCRA